MAQPGTTTRTAACSETARPDSQRSRTVAMLPAPGRAEIAPITWLGAPRGDPSRATVGGRRRRDVARVARLPARHLDVEVRVARRRRAGASERATFADQPPRHR